MECSAVLGWVGGVGVGVGVCWVCDSVWCVVWGVCGWMKCELTSCC